MDLSKTKKTKRVAIIGVGVSGLCMLRSLSEICNFELTAFERNYDLGGIWLYTDETRNNVYGQPIINPVYYFMRSNICTQLIELEGLPFNSKPFFPSHTEVLEYINNISDSCDLRRYIKFNTEVRSVRPIDHSVKNPKWLVSYQDIRNPDNHHTEEFDAVVVSNGNCRIPKYPIVPGEERFNGLIIHSIRYRRPEIYRDHTVAVLGKGYSGVDISFDLIKHAKQVFLCHQGPQIRTKLPPNITEKTSGFKKFTESSVILLDGEELFVDSVIFCTGYTYEFSFLPEGIVEIGENRIIANLFKTIVSVQYSNLFFMGTLRDGSFFLTGERTAHFITAVLDGTIVLPEENQMRDIIEKDKDKFAPRDGWIYLIDDLAKLSNRVRPISLALVKIWQNIGERLRTDFHNCKRVSYRIIGTDSYDIF